MECQLCKHKPSRSNETNGASFCQEEKVNLFRIKNTYFEDTVDGLKDYGQCPSFELRRAGLTEWELCMMDRE